MLQAENERIVLAGFLDNVARRHSIVSQRRFTTDVEENRCVGAGVVLVIDEVTLLEGECGRRVEVINFLFDKNEMCISRRDVGNT